MKIVFISVDPKGAVIRGAGYVAASIPNGNEIIFYCSTNADKMNKYKGLTETISKIQPDIIMVSTTTILYNEAAKAIKAIKASNDIPILMGGVHPTIVGPKVLIDNENIDYLCIGEGETFIKEFVNKYGTLDLLDINNLAYRRDGKVVVNPLNPPEDLSALPPFPYKLFKRVVSKKTVSASVSRGCPFSCTYCGNSTFLKMYGKGYVRQIPIDYVMKEIEYLKHNYKFKQIHFSDDTILTNPKYATELLTRLNISYTCMSRAESIDEEMVAVLKKTGCTSVGMGVECGDEAFRKKYLRRFMSNEQIKRAFKLLQKAGIKTTSYNMIGWPFDNDDELTKSTADLNKELNPNIVQVTWFYPFPGTKLYEHCKEHDLINEKLVLGSYHKGSIIKGYENKKSFFKSRTRKSRKGNLEMKNKLIFVCGVRPNFMKIAPLVRACKKYNVSYKIVHTGQHYADSMSKVFFDELQIPTPDYNLNVGSESHAQQTSKIMSKFEYVCEKENPEIVVVVGDVNSTLACAMVVSKMPNIKLAHVEAGCRSFDRSMPEEINRIVTDVLSDYLFALDESNVINLVNEGIPQNKIFLVGDTMVDNLLYYSPLIKENIMGSKPFILTTIHRASNTDNKETLEAILKSLEEVARTHPVIFPIHPRTRKMIETFDLTRYLENITCLSPLSYMDFLKYLKYASVVVTDSGSLQIETTILHKRCLTVRENTERMFTLDEGTNSLITPKEIVKSVWEHLISSVGLTHHLSKGRRKLLDGNAAERIIKSLVRIK